MIKDIQGTIKGKVTSAVPEIKGKVTTAVPEIKGSVSIPPYKPFVTDDYEVLKNQPQINSETLIGNKTLEDLGDHTMTNMEIKEIFEKVFRRN